MAYCLLSLDLKNVDNKQRDTFYAVLAQQEWSKVGNVDTTWQCVVDDIYHEPSIKRRVQKVLEEAAKLAEIEQVNFVFQIGDHQSRIGELVLEHGFYKFSLD